MTCQGCKFPPSCTRPYSDCPSMSERHSLSTSEEAPAPTIWPTGFIGLGLPSQPQPSSDSEEVSKSESDKPIFPKVEVVQYDKVDPEEAGHIVGALRINGTEFHCPVGSEVVITAAGESLTAVTATFFVSEVQVVTRER